MVVARGAADAKTRECRILLRRAACWGPSQPAPRDEMWTGGWAWARTAKRYMRRAPLQLRFLLELVRIGHAVGVVEKLMSICRTWAFNAMLEEVAASQYTKRERRNRDYDMVL